MEMNNVVAYKNNSVGESIQIFIESKMDNSENTAKNYKSWIEYFFIYVLGKEMQELTWNDIIRIQYKDVLKYRRHLINTKKNKNKTANTKLEALRSLWNYLHRECKEINLDVMKLDRLKESNSDGWGSLTEKEWNALLEFCSKQKHKADIKRMYFELAIITSLRSTALLNIKWKDIKKKMDNKTQQEIWVITIFDKGKEVKKPITNTIYDKICALKNLSTQKEDYILNICSKTLSKVLSDFCEEYKIDQEERKIVLHSLKKASLDYVYSNSKDVMVTSRAAGHSTPKYIYDTYVGKNASLVDNPSYSMFNKNDEIEKLEKLNKEDLINLIKQSGKWVVDELVKNM